MPDSIWQQRAVHKLRRSEGRGIIWATQGEGKTRVAIRYFALLQNERPNSICVFVGRRAAFWDYTSEIRSCGYNNWLVDDYNPNLPRFSKKNPTVWLVSHAMLEKQWASLTWFENISLIVYDELYLFSNIKAKRTKSAIALSKEIDAPVVGLSGTIMPSRDNSTVWGQASVIGIQHLLARNLTEFRSRYQTCKLIQMGARNVPITKNKPNSKHEILRKLDSNIFLHFPKSEKRSILQKFNEVPQTKEQEKIIKQLKEEYYADLPNGKSLDIKVALELVIKIQQISNGWIKDSEGLVHSIKTNKTAAIKQSVSELVSSGEQCIVWCAFKNDIAILQTLFGIPCLTLQGGREFDVDAWKSGNYRLVLATESSGASVNHFSNVRYAKYFSMAFSWLALQQSKMRTNRRDSRHKTCHYEYFFVRDTLDRHAYDTATSSGKTESDFIRSGMLKSWLYH